MNILGYKLFCTVAYRIVPKLPLLERLCFWVFMYYYNTKWKGVRGITLELYKSYATGKKLEKPKMTILIKS